LKKAARQWDDTLLQKDWKSLIYVDESLLDSKTETVTKDLDYKKCCTLKNRKSVKFWLGVSQNGRKFIVEPSYFTKTQIFSKQFLNLTQRNPNVAKQLTNSPP
jgi:hypothetical protein